MKLSEYLDETGMTIMNFSRRSRLSYSQVRYILAGKVPSLRACLLIDNYTKGAVTPQDLAPDDIIKDVYGTD